ncbi:twin-arginine translocase TatA/TatE family subunit [Cohnella thailandensis]|uniref:Sec-independent protein translocase protein TatA n=1 Tax=Cohnella thailandensis TaxID=557557 RepID=A0A841SS86_9BACL|nr:twin-arginine translocase TatA/TatE family subunit [Cohnella thailandensis]MBB6633456.1 twin-arginine translocase TatA/TatE family subunit [Cohnella thailandensis]MBP1974471.1 sec-independent protein translocase protein TatA [Cohnella thailandensis]
MGGIGATGFILLVIVALLLFGPNKLPELGKAFGKTLREFKRGANGLMEDDSAAAPRRVEVNAQEAEQPKAERRLPE